MSELEPKSGDILNGGDVVAAYLRIEAATDFAMRISRELGAAERELKERIQATDDIDLDTFSFESPIPADLILEATPNGDLGSLAIQKAIAWRAVELLKERQVSLLKQRLMPEGTAHPKVGITKIDGYVFSELDEIGATRHTDEDYLEGVVTKLSDRWLVLQVSYGKNYLVEPLRRDRDDKTESGIQIVILED